MLWETKGPKNTQATVEAAMQRARELGIEQLVVASNSGRTARLLLGHGFEVVCVTHHVGYKGPAIDEMSPEARAELQAAGVRLLTTTHLLAGVDRAVARTFGGIYPAELIAHTLRIFGQGIKVGIEIAIMALDAGLIPYGREIVSIAGSGRGADSAQVILPDHSPQFFATQVKEIICMPRNK